MLEIAGRVENPAGLEQWVLGLCDVTLQFSVTLQYGCSCCRLQYFAHRTQLYVKDLKASVAGKKPGDKSEEVGIV